jgi:acetyl-CoA/propionyl-CoA carboxylase, biotin carboxylase, biotin carboxyl carrier protein
VQVLADAHGAVIHLGERECSLQRRHQKIIEEAPSPLLTPAQRDRMGKAACEIARSVAYRGVGTIEFLVSDAAPDEFFFMEMNTRLQVEHPVTELVTGIDLVEQQLRVVAGEPLALAQEDVVLSGHAIEARLYSEDPARGFLPATGTIEYLREASGAGIRVDSSLLDGLRVGSNYDPMLAKIIGFGADRGAALRTLDAALAETVVLGVRTNREFLVALLRDPAVRAGALDTGLIERTEIAYLAPSDDVFVIAALAREQAVQIPTPWSRYRGWRLGEHRPAHYGFRVGDDTVTVAVGGNPAGQNAPGGNTVTIGDDEPGPARLIRDGASARLERGGRMTVATLLESGTHSWVSVGPATFDLTLQTREQQLSDHRAGLEHVDGVAAPDIRAPMPGTVVVVAASTGQSVEAGQLLVTIEAMKMEHKLLSPTAGVVTIDVSAGDLVSLDQVVATISPSGTHLLGESPHEGAAA